MVDGNPKICDVLCVHLSLVYWAVTRWRPYLVYLAQDLDEHVGLRNILSRLALT